MQTKPKTVTDGVLRGSNKNAGPCIVPMLSVTPIHPVALLCSRTIYSCTHTVQSPASPLAAGSGAEPEVGGAEQVHHGHHSDHKTVSDLDIPRWIWIQQIRRQLLERRACTGTWKPLRPRDVHLPDTRPQSRISRAVMPPTVSARSLAEANLFSRMRPRAAVGQCDRTVRMPAPCPSHVRAVHTTIARFGPRTKFPTFLH